MKKILVIGVAGGLSKITTGLLLKELPDAHIYGVDSRPLGDFPFQSKRLKLQKIRYSRSHFEKLFRENSFDTVLHLGRFSHVNTQMNLTERLDLNLMGTRRILDLSLKNNLKKIVIMSTFHVYGALQDNPAFISEDYPLRASIRYPDLRDVVEMDQISTNWMWKNQKEIETIVLRPCNIVGPQIHNAISKYLRASYAPIPVDFNPMMQFIHEFDMAQILVQSLKLPTGVYNVAPDEVVSLRKAREIIGKPSLNIPLFMFEPLIRAASNRFWKMPDYLLDYIKFACIIDNKELKNNLKPHFRFNTKETLQLLQS